MPEGWSAGKSSRMEDTSKFPKSQLPGTPGSQYPEEPSSVPPDPPGKAEPPGPLNPKRYWWKNWVIWAALASLSSGSVAFIAVTMLLKLPSAPNCPGIFWPLASASVRLYCAQVAANKQTAADLLKAIALVQALPDNHPLRPEANRSIEQWSQDVLALADEEFQAGRIEEAIAIARQIPQNVPAYESIEAQITQWQSVWSEAEAIYKEVEAELSQQRWHQAFMAAVRLLNVGNNYWATTKYAELNRLIETTRADANKLAKAQDLANSGGLDNLLKALKLAQSIGASSYIHQKAQDIIPEIGRQMLELAQATLDRKEADEAIAIANQIPASTGLQAEAQDFVTLAEAWRSAWMNTIPSLEAAILTAQKIGLDRPSYTKAQELIARWQLEIEDVAHLDRARELAQGGTLGDLTAAITEAQLIPETNPRADEARQEIDSWRRQVETIEDRPYLDRAEELALPEDENSLQIAINEASQITRGRALYREAQRKIRRWTSQIERIQDQPYLDQARELASSGNLPAAIAAAQQIRPGRALSGEARAAINDWQGQIQARQNWRQARRIALVGTPDALVEAIRLANRVPANNPLRIDVNAAINQWSRVLLRIAQDRGAYDIPGGIAIAKQIPRSSDAYRVAQEQIATWEQFLNPANFKPASNLQRNN